MVPGQTMAKAISVTGTKHILGEALLQIQLATPLSNPVPFDKNAVLAVQPAAKDPSRRETSPPKSHPQRSRTPKANLIPVWDGKEYQRHEEGERLIQVRKIQGPEWVRSYSRWSIRLECCLTDEPGEVSYFMNMGNDREGPRAGRHSNYYKAWTLANGGPPRKGEAMDPKIFLDKFFRAQVTDCKKDSNDKDKPKGDVYSHITELRELVSP